MGLEVQFAAATLAGGTASALTGGRFGDGALLAALASFSNDRLHNVNFVNPQDRGPGMVDTSLGDGTWKWVAQAKAADVFTQVLTSQPSPPAAAVFNDYSLQFSIAATATIYPIAGLFTVAGLLFSAAAVALNPLPSKCLIPTARNVDSSADSGPIVMGGLVPAIYRGRVPEQMAGARPAMTNEGSPVRQD